MNTRTKYLYDNKQIDALERLKGLEAIEDENTISILEKLPKFEGQVCLEIGAGAGSIAEWLAVRVGQSGAVVATDIEPTHLNESNYEVLRHDIEKDDLPHDEYDLIHFRHLLMHLTDPTNAVRKMLAHLKPGGFLLAEESDLDSWLPNDELPERLRLVFQSGVEAILELYGSRGMVVDMGSTLSALLTGVGFSVDSQHENKRMVSGGSPEAIYQSMSANQLADELISSDNESSQRVRQLAQSLLDPELHYQSRTTVSVLAMRPE